MREETPKKNSSTSDEYLMESEDETVRLDVKTDPEALRRQALWCGVKPGMRILDVCCGPGRTTSLLSEMIQPGGNIVGIDFSKERIIYAKEHYGDKEGIEFHLQDLRQSMEWLGEFDLVWVRFVLEYFRKEALDIVKRIKNCVKPGGHLCLIDLDYNCLNYYELPEPMAAILPRIMNAIDEQYNFDTYVGRKLYSFLYDNGFENIEVELMAHNLIYGDIKEKDKFNLTKKIEIAIQRVNPLFRDYPGGAKKFYADFIKYLADPRRFTYTPLLLCKGEKPLS
jgi:Methylase involved in ubiquinone/menaquinone biosynthesis